MLYACDAIVQGEAWAAVVVAEPGYLLVFYLSLAFSVLLHFYETKVILSPCNSSRQNLTASFTCLLGRKSVLRFNPPSLSHHKSSIGIRARSQATSLTTWSKYPLTNMGTPIVTYLVTYNLSEG
ncbi:hypothetical protein PIB30_067319 [Stylosanthes scabra]|uniref:Uncharacterized protein n=1 Tax=Stylosanthes scabra TaxID=79078 RepID=A0ABU6RMH8_9FABA|nr:hypothetical protein [Stylosanthes scabra]